MTGARPDAVTAQPTVAGPLTLGTAGHIDHGKTALVAALTGVDTDRLPEEARRGISIALGYAPLRLPGGEQLSVVDVPGHERFVRTMVSGATGIDLYLMVVAADDGVMPQTVEHAAVLGALGVSTGVVAITKADLADPAPAEAAAARLLPGAAEIVVCSAVTGAGIEALAQALERVAQTVKTRAAIPGAPLLHIDRSFTVDGIGTVVTGTLWSGTLQVGDRLTLLPGGRTVRIRSLQIHDRPASTADAGQRVAVSLAGVRARETGRGDVLTVPGRVGETEVVDCALALGDGRHHGARVQLHHGTRDVPARLSHLGGDLWQLRLEKPILAADGDRVVVRRLSPPDTLGGGRILDARAHRHGRRPQIIERLRTLAAGERPAPGAESVAPPPVPPAPAPPGVDPETLTRLEAALGDAGLGLLSTAMLDGADTEALALLRHRGAAVRVAGRLYAHGDVAAEATRTIVGLIQATGSTTLAETRDALGVGRRAAQAWLEHLDAQRITHREPDDRRVLRPRAAQRLPS